MIRNLGHKLWIFHGKIIKLFLWQGEALDKYLGFFFFLVRKEYSDICTVKWLLTCVWFCSTLTLMWNNAWGGIGTELSMVKLLIRLDSGKQSVQSFKSASLVRFLKEKVDIIQGGTELPDSF